jgi:hypothetical protein
VLKLREKKNSSPQSLNQFELLLNPKNSMLQSGNKESHLGNKIANSH